VDGVVNFKKGRLNRSIVVVDAFEATATK
jgi:hypothetical protein